jgi:predicted alpha/beta-hydrolase family hydrolase
MGNVTHQRVRIPLNEKEKVSAVAAAPANFQEENRIGVILAHGAGNDMENPLIVSLADGLAATGFLTLRFNFPYKEKGRRAPDPQKKLVQTWQQVLRFLQNHSDPGPQKIIAAGKSMGGRVASQMAADGELAADGLVFLGYPLHSPGQKDKLRDAHLYDLRVPLLFFAGTRDTLCDLDLLHKVLKRLKAEWDLEVIEGGDHSFGLPKSAAISQQKVYDQILDRMIDWLNIGVNPKS